MRCRRSASSAEIAAAGIFGASLGVLQRAGMRRAQPGRPDGADERGDRAVPRRARRPGGPEAHGLAVVGERNVEEHDAAARRARLRVELLEAVDDQHFGLDAVAAWCRRCRRGRASPSHGAPARQSRRSRCRAPIWAPSRARCARSRARRASSRRPPIGSRARAPAMPLRRWPIVSVRTARRSQANVLPSASPISRAAGSRYCWSQAGRLVSEWGD